MMIQYNIGQFSSQMSYSAINYADYGFFSQGQGGIIPPPPVNSAIVIGLTMVAQGLTILSTITTNLDKGLVEDELNLITRQ